MKVIFYISNLSGGGAERVFVNLINFLSNKEIPIELVLNQKEGPLLSVVDDSIPIHTLKAKNSRGSVFELAQYLEKSKPDVAFSTLFNCNYALILAEKLCSVDVKVLTREANSFLTKRKNFSTARLIYEKLKAKIIYPLADKIFVNSEGARKELSEAAGIQLNSIDILPNPINFQEIRKKGNEELSGEFRKLLDNKPFIVAVGRLENAKGFDVLIEAFGLLKIKGYRLVILGEGNERLNLQKKIKSLGLDGRILMPGYVDNPYAVMAKANLFVLSSRYEGMPNVLLEAMSLELPIVATDCPNGPRELLKNGEFGTLVPVDNEERLSAAIEKKIGKDITNVQERMKYIKQFDVENIGETFFTFIKN